MSQCLLVTAFILFHLIVVLDAGKRKSTYYEIAQCNELCESEEKKGSYKWGKCLKYYVEDIVETEDKRYGKYGPRYYCRGTYMNVCFCKNDRCKLYKLRRSPIDLSLSRCRFSETLLRANNHTCSSTPCKTKLKCSEKGTDTCKTGNGSCTCVCKKGFTGELCDKCDQSFCQNEGTCTINRNGNPICNCISGTTGIKCEESLLTGTTQQPVTNSTTNIAVVTHDKTTAFGDFTTTASPQSTEEPTTTPMNACSLKCQNGGTCVVEDAAEACICLSGFTGASCELEPCSASPCINNGSCRINQTGYTCDCPSDYGGKNCEIPKFCSHCDKKGIISSAVAGSSCTSYRVGDDIFDCPKGLNFDPNLCGCVISPIATACAC